MSPLSPRLLPRSLPTHLSLAQGSQYHQGIAAALLTTLMWASWLISVKLGTTSSLTTFDLAIASYFTFRARKQLQKTPWSLLVGICLGAGLPFFFLGSLGMHYAPVTHAGVLLPGTFPFFVTGIAVLFYRETLSKNRLVGLIAIALGVSVLLLQSFSSIDANIWKGDLIFLLASFCWSIFCVCVRISGLSSFVVAGLFGSVSSVMLLFLFLIGVVDSGIEFSLPNTPLGFYAIQFIVQGVLVGLIASVSFSFAIAKIGAENTAMIGSLTPVIAIVLAFFVFSEMPTYLDFLAMVFVCFGVLRASDAKLFKK